jgi:hypothetical protein
MTLIRCDDQKHPDACGLLQLREQTNADELYFHDYGYRSGLNATMTNHLTSVANEIKGRGVLQKGDIICDIGSNDATFLKQFGSDIVKIGIDPTSEQFKQYYTSDINILADYFNKDSYRKMSPVKAKVITSIACFYDLPKPMDFVRDVKECLDNKGIWVFEQSYMPLMLKTKSLDTVCQEHLEYYSLKSIKHMMDKADFKIIDVNFNDINGGSFRVTVTPQPNKDLESKVDVNGLLDEEIKMGLNTPRPYEEFMRNSEYVKHELTSFLKQEKEKGKSIYIYGASTKGNCLLQYCGIDNTIVTAAAERNPEKFGRRTPGTDIPIISEAEARAANPDYFLVLPWHFKDEFIKRERDYLLNGGKLIFPLPKFQVVSKEDLYSFKILKQNGRIK